jgi:ribonuclease VapC
VIVLDASCVLAYLFSENGRERAEQCLATGVISSVNVTEIVGKQIDKGLDPKMASDRYEGLNLPVRIFDEETAILAGQLRAATAHRGLSLGDRACLALAIRENATAVTADRKWADLRVGCRIELIR